MAQRRAKPRARPSAQLPEQLPRWGPQEVGATHGPSEGKPEESQQGKVLERAPTPKSLFQSEARRNLKLRCLGSSLK